MGSNVMTVATTTPLTDVARLLSEHQVTGMPVTDEVGHIVGVLSMRDIIERYADGDADHRVRSFYELVSDEGPGVDREALELPYDSQDLAGDVMTAQVHTVHKDAPLPEVAQQMVELGVHRLLVEDGGKHVGLISTTDVLRAVAGMGG